jgi:putative signal transducing protein
MEDLSEKVYECTLAVEAHMICDLLARAGVSARVEGEFLAGAGGDLPLGNMVKVRVDPARAAEAREIIAEWEKQQPAESPPAPRRSSWNSPLWFVAGLVTGGALLFILLNRETGIATTDYDGDGHDDATYHYAGDAVRSIDFDRNADGRTDARDVYDRRGLPEKFLSDDDYDGRFEWQSEYENGWVTTVTLDEDGNGQPDLVQHFHLSMPLDSEIHDESGERIVARQHFTRGWHTSTDVDLDGDGTFEKHIEYDRYGVPR